MSDLAEIAARGAYAENGWWRVVKPNDDGKGRYRDGGTMRFRAVEWEDLEAEERVGLIRDARHALTAIEKAGHRIVPVEPTAEMKASGLSADEEHFSGRTPVKQIWTAMLGAAPKVTL